jgi:hypothetical protein
MLNLRVNLENIEDTVEATRSRLENFGLIEKPVGSRRKEESQFRWVV